MKQVALSFLYRVNIRHSLRKRNLCYVSSPLNGKASMQSKMCLAPELLKTTGHYVFGTLPHVPVPVLRLLLLRDSSSLPNPEGGRRAQRFSA